MATLTGGQIVWILDAETGEFQRALLNAEEQADQTGKKVESSLSRAFSGAKEALGDFASALGQVGFGLFTTAAGIASTALTGLAVKGVQAADFMETTKIAMQGLTGSLEDGNEAMRIANKFWEDNPFNRMDVVPAVKSLVQFGRTTKQLQGDLELLGSISLATNTPINDLAMYFARASGAGRAMTEDLEMMAFRGVPIYQKLVEVVRDSDEAFAAAARESLGLAKGATVTTGQIRELAKDGAISFELFEAAMRKSVNPEIMKQFEQTFSRQVDRLKGSLSILAGEMGGYRFEAGKLIIEQDGLNRATTRLAEAFATGLRTKEMRESINRLGKALVPIIDALTEALPGILENFGKALDFVSKNTEVLVPILGGALILFGQLGAGLPGIGGVVANLSEGVKRLAGSFWSLIKVNPLVAALVALLGAGLVQAWRTNEDFRNSVKRLFEALIKLSQKLMPAIMNLVDAFADLASSGAFIKLLDLAVIALTKVVELIAKIPEPVFTALIGGFLAFKTIQPFLGIAKTATGVVGGLGKVTGGLKAGQAAGGRFLGATIASIFTPLGRPEVLRGAGAAALIGVALITISIGLSKASSVNIDLGNLGKVVGAIAVLTVIFNLLGRIRVSPASLLTVIAITGVLVLVGRGLQDVDRSMPSNIGNFARKMANMGIAIGSIGLLSVISGKLIGQILPGLVAVLAIAGTLVLVGRAIKDADNNIPAGVGDFSKKIANLAIAITAMGVLAGVLGAIVATGIGALVIAAGLATMLAIAGALTLISQAIAVMDRSIPNNLDAVKSKIDLVVDVVQHIVKANLGNILGNLVGALNIRAVEKIVTGYMTIAEHLSKLGTIEINSDAVLQKIELLKEVISQVASQEGDSLSGQISSLLKNFVGSLDVSVISRTVGVYFDIANKLKEIEGVQLNPDAIKERVNLIKEVIESISATDETSVMGTINRLVNNFLGAVDVSQVSKVVSTYHDIGNKLMEIQGLKLNPKAIDANINKLGEVIEKVSYNGTGSWWENLTGAVNEFLNASSVESAGKVVNTYAGIIDSIGKIATMDFDMESIMKKVEDLTRVVKYVLGTKGGGGLFAAIGNFFAGGPINEQQVGMVQSIINKFSEMAQTLNNMVSLGSNTNDKIAGIRHAIYEIGSINEVPNIQGKEMIVGYTQSILNKMTGLAQTINNMVSLGDNSFQKIEAIRRAIYEIGSINEVPNMGGREVIVSQAQSILNKMTGMAQTLNNLVSLGDNSIQKIVDIRHAIYQIGQVNEVPGMGNKEWIVGMSQSILNKMIGFAHTVNSMPSVGEDKMHNLRTVRHAVWEATQVSENVGNIANKEMIIATANRMLVELKKFATTLATLPNAQGQAGLVQTLISNVNAMMSSAVSNITQNTFQFANAGKAISAKFAEGIRSGQGVVQAAGSALQGAAWRGIQNNLGHHVPQGAALAGQLAQGISSGRPAVQAAGASLQGAMWHGIQAKMRDEFHQGVALANSLADGIRSRGRAAYDAGHSLQSSMWRGVQDRMGDMYRQGRALAENLVRGMRDGSSGAYSVGANAAQGFINGANSKSSYSSGWNIANTFLQGLKDRGQQGSPWKTTKEIGNFAVEGLSDGITENQNYLLRTATSLVDSLLNVLNLGDVAIEPKFKETKFNFSSDIADVQEVSRGVGKYSFGDDRSTAIENNIGEIHIGSQVEGEDWLRRLTRQDEITRVGLTPNV